MLLRSPRPTSCLSLAPTCYRPPAPMDDRVLLRARIDPLTGYGQHACHIVRQLRDRGIPVDVLPLQTWEPWGHRVPEDIRACFVTESTAHWELLIAPPGNRGETRRHTVYWSMWESGRLQAEHVAQFNRSAAVLVPCEWNQIVFDSSGVTAPLHHVPLGLTREVFTPTPLPDPRVFRIGAGGRMAHGGLRKGVYQVFEAFRQAFPVERDVHLDLKIFEDCPFPTISDPRVTVIRAPWTEPQMAAWCRTLHLFASGATGEGYGLMPLQAMACGRPVAITEVTGHAEYFDASVGFPVGYTWRDCRRVMPEQCFYEGAWAVPEIPSLAAALRAAYRLRGTRFYGELGRRAAARAQRFGWDAAAERLVGALRRVGMLA